MKHWKRLLGVLLLLLLGNVCLLLGVFLPLSGLSAGLAVAALIVLYLWLLIFPFPVEKEPSRRLHALMGGYELALLSGWAVALETVLLIVLAVCAPPVDPVLYWVNLLVFLLVCGLSLLDGFVRILITSSHLRLVWRLLLLFCWWVPVLNIFIFARVLWLVRNEYHFELLRRASEQAHAENMDCCTRYPLVMVHGIFFRDWQHIGYWGRIPQALQKSGAQIYYGGQQSAAAVEQSASELKKNIEAILAETGAEKVNIIAHSKGGLDSRYAISCLGLAGSVASLTTINTPHRGCVFAQVLLGKLPKGLVRFIERKYNALFQKLGDTAPDFMGGVRDLTAERCAELNEKMPDAPEVYYQSVMSIMKSAHAAGFPLNMSWRLVRRYDREENDGLVARSSAPWGNFLGEVSVQGKRGISHGDMIDLMHEDIPDFSVREYYIDLVHGLKDKGF